jgi:peptidoglycan hydrolase-like protein with peptidoglycan-binding domain
MRRRKLLVRSLCFALLVCFFAGRGTLRADQTTAAVQQALKDQGFYYGEVSGQKSVDTTAAIRRYQIRNGLQITGAIDAETLRSLGVGAVSPRGTPGSRSTTQPSAPDQDGVGGQSAEIPSDNPPTSPPTLRRSPGQYYVPAQRGAQPEMSGVFNGTPYEIAPPDLQRHVIVGAQTLLARSGFYRSGIDGEYGPGTAAAVLVFQRRTGLLPSGRLNMETLAALGLLPGQHGPAYVPYGRRRLPPYRPIYRGQWIPE